MAQALVTVFCKGAFLSLFFERVHFSANYSSQEEDSLDDGPPQSTSAALEACFFNYSAGFLRNCLTALEDENLD